MKLFKFIFSCGLLCSVFLIRENSAANILVVGTLLSHSHHFWNEAVALGLVDKGHNVTILTHDKSKVKRENYTVITLEGVYEKFEAIYSSDEMNHFTITPTTIPSFVNNFFGILTEMCKYDIEHPTLYETLLSYPKDFKFDVILWDHTAGECLYPIIQQFGNPPLVGLSPYGLSNSIEDIYGTHVYSYVGQVVMPFVIANTFLERLLNIFFINYSNYVRNTAFKQKSVELSKTKFWDWDETKFEEVEKRFSLCLINWNIALNVPQPLSPNLIPVGGVQIKHGEVLPKEFQEVFNKPSDGIIFFSLGSNIKSEVLPIETLQSFCDCLEQFQNYQVIWKIKVPKELKLPSNVFATKWAPQTTILAQKKTKLFITHGGGLSVQETSHFGVPIVGVAVFLDQINNANKLEAAGAGEAIPLEDINNSKHGKELFCQKVKDVLFKESYRNNMEKLSERYRGGERTPLQTAVHWVEYVLKHGDAKHLSPLSRDMSSFYTQNLDIYAAFIGFILLQILIFVGIVKFIVKRYTGKGSKKVKTN